MKVLPVFAAAVEGEALVPAGARELGPGKAAAAAAMTELLCAGAAPDLVLLFGVCGAYPERHGGDPGLVPGTLCLVGEDRFGDEGAALPGGFAGLQELGLADPGPLTMDPIWTDRAAGRLGAPVVRGATVSTCSGTEATSAALAARTGAQIETMEGAAVALACALRGVPLLQLRAVSNFTGDRARGAWDLERAVEAVQSGTRRLLEVLRG